MAKASERRTRALSYEQLMALPHHERWLDGRFGFLWARFDAPVLPVWDERYLRAELTWADDLEDDGADEAWEAAGNEGERPLRYFDPQLKLETNQMEVVRRSPKEFTLATHDAVTIDLTQEEVEAILGEDPAMLLVRYAGPISRLKPAAPAGKE